VLAIGEKMSKPFIRHRPAAEGYRTTLSAAWTIRSQEVYAGMTTAGVAWYAGVLESMLYRHFSSQRAILHDLALKEAAR
jgi:AcrR family transcriptional regulator